MAFIPSKNLIICNFSDLETQEIIQEIINVLNAKYLENTDVGVGNALTKIGFLPVDKVKTIHLPDEIVKLKQTFAEIKESETINSSIQEIVGESQALFLAKFSSIMLSQVLNNDKDNRFIFALILGRNISSSEENIIRSHVFSVISKSPSQIIFIILSIAQLQENEEIFSTTDSQHEISDFTKQLLTSIKEKK